jgi:hypothetical protein
MSDLSNDTKKHTTKSRETIPLKESWTNSEGPEMNAYHTVISGMKPSCLWRNPTQISQFKKCWHKLSWSGTGTCILFLTGISSIYLSQFVAVLTLPPSPPVERQRWNEPAFSFFLLEKVPVCNSRPLVYLWRLGLTPVNCKSGSYWFRQTGQSYLGLQTHALL